MNENIFFFTGRFHSIPGLEEGPVHTEVVFWSHKIPRSREVRPVLKERNRAMLRSTKPALRGGPAGIKEPPHHFVLPAVMIPGARDAHSVGFRSGERRDEDECETSKIRTSAKMEMKMT